MLRYTILMKANPGGILDISEVIGREILIKQIWNALKNQSVVLTSERRIGKTSVIRKMAAQAAANEFYVIIRDIEGLRTPEEFVETVYADVEKQLAIADKAKLRFLRLIETLGGTQISDVKLPNIKTHWKTLLNTLFDDLFAAEQRHVIFFWDELPLFIFNVAQSSGDSVAMELLDVLRGLRQRHTRLRMVFTGSVGIHQVVSNLKKSGYANDPTNDMATIEVPPLEPQDGAYLASCLLVGESLCSTESLAELSILLSEATGHIPYYTHSLVSRLRTRGMDATPGSITGERDLMIQDPNDAAHFSYYVERLATYYSPSEARLARYVLDVLSAAEGEASFAEIANLVKHKMEMVDDDQLRQVLTLLEKDHYVHRRTSSKYSFRYAIVQRYWLYARGRS